MEEEKGRIEWLPYDEGRTIGKTGSERGIILRDEHWYDVTRITLERDGYTPFAITCGFYGWLVHTTFGDDLREMEQRYEDMKLELVRFWDLLPNNSDPEKDKKMEVFYTEIHTFIDKFR